MLSPTERADLLARIARVLDHEIARDLEIDVGPVELVGIDDDRIVQLRLGGDCPACGLSPYAIAMAIETAVKARVPEIRFIEVVP